MIYSISKLHVTVTVSKTADKLKDIPGIYEEVKEGRHYRQFENASQVIDLSRREDMPPAESYYPFALEKEVVRALRLEERDEVERRIRLFIREPVRKRKNGNPHPAGHDAAVRKDPRRDLSFRPSPQ